MKCLVALLAESWPIVKRSDESLLEYFYNVLDFSTLADVESVWISLWIVAGL